MFLQFLNAKASDCLLQGREANFKKVIIMIVNMTEYCKEHNIDSFSRNRGGWLKEIERFERNHPKGGGWAFVGSRFTKVGNFESNIKKGLYIDCSKKAIDDKVEETINIFEVTQDEIKLLQTGKKTQGWAKNFYNTVEEWFKTYKDTTVQDIIDAVNSITDDTEKMQEALNELIRNDKFSNRYEAIGYMKKHRLLPVPSVKFVEKCSTHSITREMAQKYKGGYTLADEDLDFIEVTAIHYGINIDDCKIIAESIEPHQLKSQSFYTDLEEIGDTEVDNYGRKTIGWFFENKRHNCNDADNRYNILIVTCNKETNTIYLKYCDVWVDWMTFW